MNISGVRPGDIVEVDKRGRTFHALVRGASNGEVRIQPLSTKINYYAATAREVTGHWRASKRTRIEKGWDS